MLQKSSTYPGPYACKSGPGNNMISRRNHLLYIFDNNSLHLASIYATKYFKKKLARENDH